MIKNDSEYNEAVKAIKDQWLNRRNRMPIYTCDADKNRIVHFGHGDLIVSTSECQTEVVITPSNEPGNIGDHTDQIGGMDTSKLVPGVRMVFDTPESCLVVIDALSKVAQYLMRRQKDKGSE